MSNSPHLVTFLVVVLLSSTAAVLPNDDFCTSPEFRAAFLEGQGGVVIDYTSPSPHLIQMGDRALPCLIQVSEHGGASLGFADCVSDKHRCEGWAMTAIRMIGTPRARQYLICQLDPANEPYQVRMAIRELGTLREPGARAGLHKLLQHSDAQVRVESLTSLAAIGDPSDFEVMLKAALGFPDEYLRSVANAFRIYGDMRAFDPLSERIGRIADPETRHWAERILLDWREQEAKEERVVTILQSGSGPRLYKTLQELQIQSKEVHSALLDLLTHADPRVRAESVRALARFREEADFDRLLDVTLALPEPYVTIAARGLEQLNNQRAIKPLEDYASHMKERREREQLEAIISRLRRQTSPEGG